MPPWISELLAPVASVLAVGVPAAATAHIVLSKRDVGAAIAWVGVVWLVPIVGVVLYAVFGLNRIRREAQALRGGKTRYHLPTKVEPVSLGTNDILTGTAIESLRPLAHLVQQVAGRSLLPGNRVDVLVDGDEAYPAMLEAIEKAERTITLATYIFDKDPVGMKFVDALARAKDRGVEVRVLVDAAGSRYSVPTILGPLRSRRVPAARFLPTWLPWRVLFFNLRNHRKILVVDGSLAFAGGINIRQGHVLGDLPKHPVRDVHFRIAGPVVGQLQEIFAEDWQFTTKEALKGTGWFPAPLETGGIISRGIADGPDEDFDKMRWAFLGALGCARHSVRIATPYFLPDSGLLSALEVTALRGVRVTIVLPGRSNIRIMDWAMWASLGPLLRHGCRVVFTPPPFDHSKLLVVDEAWVLFGSANWDPRSLRLNFELGIECYDAEFGARVSKLIDERAEAGTELTLERVEARSLALRLRDGAARLLSPYL